MFGTDCVTFLGHEISRDGLRPDQNKVKAIKELAPPYDVSGVRRVLGAFGYYRRFIPRFAEITEPLTRLTRKNNKFDWGDTEQKAFDSIKNKLATCVTLTHLNAVDQVILKTDASLIGVAGILLQEQDKDLKIVACVSRHLTSAEKNYSPMELEALAVIYSLQKFRHFLLGRHFKIITDHVALKVLNSRATRNARVERWALALAEYDYEILYQRGKLHEDVDCLSRSPVRMQEDMAINTMVTVLPLDAADWIQAYDDDESKSLLELAGSGSDGLQLKGDLIYKDNKLYVPDCKRRNLIEESHENVLAAHDGIEGTLFRLKAFWWPTMKEDVKRYVDSCDTCQRRKVERRKPTGLMREHVSTQPLEKVAFDYVGPLPETLNKKKFIIISVDHFTRFVDAKSVKDQTAERFVRYFAEYCGRFGIPQTLVSDNGKQFDNKCLDAIRREFNTEHQIAPPGHSTGNSIVERVIQSVSDKLATIISNSNTRLDWDLALPMVMFSINSKIHSATGYAPFELVYGREAPLVQPSMRSQISNYDLHAQVIRDALSKMRANVVARSSDVHQRAKIRFDERHLEQEYNVDDEVLICVKSRSRKLGPKFEGPFKVLEKKNDIYLLENMANGRDKRRRHVSQMKQYTRAIIGLLLVTTSSKSIPLRESLPIFWEEDAQHYVSQGEETLRYIIQYNSPCIQILEFAKILMQQVPQNIMNQQTNSIMHHPVQQAPMQPMAVPAQLPPQQTYGQQYVVPRAPQYQADDDEPDSDKAKGTWVTKEEAMKLGMFKRAINPMEQQASMLHAECENVYGKTILSTLKKFNVELEKEKRQAAFIAGFIVSNIVQEVTRRWRGTPTAPEFEKTLQTTIGKMNSRANLIATAIKAMNKNLGQAQLDIIELKYEAERLPSMETFQSYLISEISSKNLLLEELAVGLQQRNTNTVHLAQIFQTQKFEELEARDVTVIDSKLLNYNTIQMTIAGHVRSKDAKVFRVKHLDFYTQWSNNTAMRNEYVGKTLLIKNNATDCVKAVDESPKPYIEIECESKTIDHSLRLWRKTRIENINAEVKHSQYVRAGNEFLIYCWGNNISIAPANSKKFDSTICPTYVFAIKDEYSFRSSDNMVNHQSKSNIHKSLSPRVFLDVSNIHFDHYLTAHEVINGQAKDIHKLLNQVEEMSKDINATMINGNAVTWRHIAVGSVGSTGLLLMFVLCICVYFKCKNQKLSIIHLLSGRDNVVQTRTRSSDMVASQVAAGFEQMQSTLEIGFNQLVQQQILDRPCVPPRRKKSFKKHSNVRIVDVSEL